MKFMFLLYGDPKVWETATPEFRAQTFAAHERLFRELEKTNGFVSGAELAPPQTARTLHDSDGKVLAVDGPFAEISEHLGGFYLIEAPDMAEAERLARMLPGNVEIRPVVENGA